MCFWCSGPCKYTCCLVMGWMPQPRTRPEVTHPQYQTGRTPTPSLPIPTPEHRPAYPSPPLSCSPSYLCPLLQLLGSTFWAPLTPDGQPPALTPDLIMSGLQVRGSSRAPAVSLLNCMCVRVCTYAARSPFTLTAVVLAQGLLWCILYLLTPLPSNPGPLFSWEQVVLPPGLLGSLLPSLQAASDGYEDAECDGLRDTTWAQLGRQLGLSLEVRRVGGGGVGEEEGNSDGVCWKLEGTLELPGGGEGAAAGGEVWGQLGWVGG
jgi:hypothetical protein